MKKEERFQIVYINGAGEEKHCTCKSVEKKESNLELCKKYGYKVVSCKKLYPFSTNKNQHNFELINNICFNRMYDIENGDKEQYEGEYDKLFDLRDKAEKYFCYPLPVAWVTWEEHQEMKELSQMAILHRQDACIANGRPDLVTYC